MRIVGTDTITDMTHKDYIQLIRKQQSFIRRLFKRRSDISEEIGNITKNYYKDIIGKFFYVSPEDRDKFVNLSDGYYFIYGVLASSNYASDDKVEIQLLVRTFGANTRGFNDDDIVGVDFMEKKLYFAPSEDIKGVIEPLIVSKEKALKPLQDYCNKLISNYTRLND